MLNKKLMLLILLLIMALFLISACVKEEPVGVPPGGGGNGPVPCDKDLDITKNCCGDGTCGSDENCNSCPNDCTECPVPNIY